MYQFLVLHSLRNINGQGTKCRSPPPHFWAHDFLSADILSDVIRDYRLFCMTHSFLLSLSNSRMCLEQRFSNIRGSWDPTTS